MTSENIITFDLVLYYNRKISKNSKSVVSSHIFITDDENFIFNIEKIENDDLFKCWEKSSKNLISQTINKL